MKRNNYTIENILDLTCAQLPLKIIPDNQTLIKAIGKIIYKSLAD